MNEFMVNLPTNTIESEILKRAGFPVTFTLDECSMILQPQRNDYIRLCKNPANPVIYYDHQHGILAALPVWIEDGELCSDDAKIRKNGFDMWNNVLYPLVKLEDKGDWISIYEQMPEELQLQVFTENFQKIPMEIVNEVFEFVAFDSGLKLDDLPEHIGNYIRSASEESDKITDMVIEKLRDIRDAIELGEDVSLSYEDNDFLEKNEEDWKSRKDKEEITVMSDDEE